MMMLLYINVKIYKKSLPKYEGGGEDIILKLSVCLFHTFQCQIKSDDWLRVPDYFDVFDVYSYDMKEAEKKTHLKIVFKSTKAQAL